ncbi:hypothetical protein ABK040_009031 [Willaertia magna]
MRKLPTSVRLSKTTSSLLDQQSTSERKLISADGLFGEPPPGYVAGIGRGATGFTTRSDIGPARVPSSTTTNGQEDDNNNNTINDNNTIIQQRSDIVFDKWDGYGENLLGKPTGQEDEEDIEADKIWESISLRLENKRKKKKTSSLSEQQQALEDEQTNNNNTNNAGTSSLPKIAATFSDIKQDLKSVTKEEWTLLPESKANTSRNINKLNQEMYQRYTPAPDHLLIGRATTGSSSSSTSLNGNTTTINNNNNSGMMTDLRALGEYKESIIKSKLQHLEEGLRTSTNSTNSGLNTTINYNEYLNNLDSNFTQMDLTSNNEEIKRYKKLFKRTTHIKPEHAPGWIARARLEELLGNFEKAKKIIRKGCEHCKANEECWLEAIRLYSTHSSIHTINNNNNNNNKGEISKKDSELESICIDAIQYNPTSVKLWLKITEIETDIEKKKKILKKALNIQTKSIQLWKEYIDLETDINEATKLLEKAVECIPDSVDLWLAYSKLKDYHHAKKILNRAVSKLPNEHQLWLAGAYLEEEYLLNNLLNNNNINNNLNNNLMDIDNLNIDKNNNINKLIKKSINYLKLNIEQWINYAYQSEDNNHLLTCQIIIKEIINFYQLKDKHLFLTYIDNSINSNHFNTSRYFYKELILKFPKSKKVWNKIINIEKNLNILKNILKEGCEIYFKENIYLWLYLAKLEYKEFKNCNEAINILNECISKNSNHKDLYLVYLALVKIYLKEEKNIVKCLNILNDAKNSNCKHYLIYIKLIQLNRKNLQIYQEAINTFPNMDIFYIMKGQFYEYFNNLNNNLNNNHNNKEDNEKNRKEAISCYQQAIQCTNGHSIIGWLSLIRMYYRPFDHSLQFFTQQQNNDNNNTMDITTSDNNNNNTQQQPYKLLTTIDITNNNTLQNLNKQSIDKVHAIIDQALLKNIKNEQLWLSNIKLDYFIHFYLDKKNTQFKQTLSKALQNIPNSDLLNSLQISLENIVQKRKAIIMNLLKNQMEGPFVTMQIALEFYRERKLNKAREWMKKAISKDRNNGDLWIIYYKMESLENINLESIEKEINLVNPKMGEIWCYISKYLTYLKGNVNDCNKNDDSFVKLSDGLDNISILKIGSQLIDFNQNIFLFLITTFVPERNE